MDPIKIFDSNMHITVDGTFKDYKRNIPSNLSTYKKTKYFSIDGVNIVGLPVIGGYEFSKFIAVCHKIESPKKIITVPWLNDKSLLRLKESRLNDFQVIKIHPRLLECSFVKLPWGEISSYCKDSGKILGICTYLGEMKLSPADESEVFKIIDQLVCDNVKLIFFHSFSRNFQSFWDRYKNEKVIFDTSFSIIRYGERLWQSYKSAILEGNGKICFGSDFPDYSLDDHHSYVEYISAGVACKLLSQYLVTNFEQFVQVNDRGY